MLIFYTIPYHIVLYHTIYHIRILVIIYHILYTIYHILSTINWDPYGLLWSFGTVRRLAGAAPRLARRARGRRRHRGAPGHEEIGNLNLSRGSRYQIIQDLGPKSHNNHGL